MVAFSLGKASVAAVAVSFALAATAVPAAAYRAERIQAVGVIRAFMDTASAEAIADFMAVPFRRLWRI